MLIWYEKARVFFREVFIEVSKVIWPDRKEVFLTVGMVVLMALVFAVFFFVVDQCILWGLYWGLGDGYGS